ncbi:chromosomal replication initiator protein DnaA [Patescibacteria group bacterium]|nr:chromosomal replication initiator protein DnaA [Patescibacteria group bacterium]MBU1721296.1 chromosomal replication initiator protein DnaA [Patescibacteria group bacterium]MBU1900828.1 chromosomal replication initiator protein DnaA [Patescibacteria group bacterium]
MTNYEIWQAVLAEFELKLSKANFTTWFRSTGIAEYQEGRIIVCVPNTFTKSWLEKKYNSDLVKTIERITGKPVKKMEYKVENMKNIAEQECFTKSQPTVSTAKTPMYTNTMQHASQFGLQPKYVFDTFIVGKQNELAHAASQAVADRPGEAYNPLFIYGDVGLGKTHLLQAVGHSMLAKNPQAKILYVSSEKFTNEFVMSVKEGRAKEFKDRYRNVDLLLIDDIQFIGGKEQTQEEFFHTFNELHQQGKQVIMTSDRPPKAILSLEDRLRSRFEWGMIADISAPDLETRVAILQAKCQEKKLDIKEDILQMIARQVQSNIRELEGALNKISAFHQLKNTPLNKEGVSSILETLETNNTKRSTTPREIIQEVMRFFDITNQDIIGKSREKRVSLPRQIAMYLLRTELDLSFPNIGQELGGRDHTTAIHAHNKIVKQKDLDLKIKQDIELIKQKIYAQGR